MKITITQISLGGPLPQFFLRDRGYQQIDLTSPPALLAGFRAHGRGNTLWLVSPPGWAESSAKANLRDPNGERTLFRFPMTSCVLRMAATDFDGTFDASLDKFDTRPFGSRDEPDVPPVAASAPAPAAPASPAPGKAVAK